MISIGELFVQIYRLSPAIRVCIQKTVTVLVHSANIPNIGATLASECGITPQDFTTYNPSPALCSSLQVGQHVCCSAGDMPDFRPQPNPDGTCASHYVVTGDSCSSLASANSLTNAEIESFNTQTWGWQGCSNVQAFQNICLSTGAPPMPAPIANAVCGPQKAGTTQPGPGTSLASLNPCPLNACCVSISLTPFLRFPQSFTTQQLTQKSHLEQIWPMRY
jgi:LysM domain